MNPPASRLIFHYFSNEQKLGLIEVIGHRRTRAFLLEGSQSHVLIDNLFDDRVIHLLKRNVSAHDQPGVRYDVYKIDYGCYVDLLSTARSPQGLFESDDGSFVEASPDDYRAIRRAILNLAEFEKAQGGDL